MAKKLLIISITVSILLFFGLITGIADNIVSVAETHVVGNESLGTLTTDLEVDFTGDDIVSGSVRVTNVTDGVEIPANNYTIDLDDGTFTLLGTTYNQTGIGQIAYTEDREVSGASRAILLVLVVLLVIGLIIALVKKGNIETG